MSIQRASTLSKHGDGSHSPGTLHPKLPTTPLSCASANPIPFTISIDQSHVHVFLSIYSQYAEKILERIAKYIKKPTQDERVCVRG